MRWLGAWPRVAAGFCSAFALAACSVEDPTFIPDAGIVDSGAPDTGTAGDDAGVRCIEVPSLCSSDEFCDDSGACVDRSRACSSTLECAPQDVCVRPIVRSSTTSAAGRCAPTPNQCDSDAQCPGAVCLAVGVCGPRAARARLEGRTLVPTASCTTAAECGVAAVCLQGACAACANNEDCPGTLRCEDSQCVEPVHCEGAADCFPGNACDGGRCLRVTTACTLEGDNEQISNALAIDDGTYLDLTICGADEDWYRLEVPEDHGLELVLTSTKSQATLTAEVLGDDGGLPAGLTRLDLPGLSVIRVPSSDAQQLFVGIRSVDHSGDYDLSVRFAPGQCTTDPVDLYGPNTTIPSNVTFEGTLCPGTQESLRFDVAAGDTVQAHLTMLGDYADRVPPEPSVGLLDGTGAVVGTPAVEQDETIASVSTGGLSGPQALTLTAKATRLNGFGETYQVRLLRQLAGRAGACQSPTLIDMSAGSALVSGDLSTAADIGRPDCTQVEDAPDFAEATRADLVYTLTASAEDVLMIATAYANTGVSPKLALSLLSDCNNDTSAQACDAAVFARAAVQVQAVLPAGQTRTLVVSSDGLTEDVGFDLQVEYISLTGIPNDRCAGATPLTTTGTQTVYLFRGTGSSSTSGARNNDTLWQDRTSQACLGADGYTEPGQGVDVYYQLDLAPGEKAAVELFGPLGGMLWSGLTCDNMPGTCQQAQVRSFERPVLKATFTASTAGGTHLVVVDGAEATDQGTFTLRTVRNAQCLSDADCSGPSVNLCGGTTCRCDDYQCQSPPSNDKCDGAFIDLGGGLGTARVFGSTGAATDDFALSCLPGGSAADVVYLVQVPAGATELVARVVNATFDPALEIRQDGCGDTEPTSVWCVDDVRLPDILLPEVRVRQPQAGTYYLVVDAFAGEGAFTLEVEIL